MNNLNELIIPAQLKKQLHFFTSNPNKLQPFSVLYGEPGTGKTSFAKYFGNKFSNDFRYFAGNEGFGKSEYEEIKSYTRTSSLFATDDTLLEKIIIIDEFHNLNKREQERFKTLYDELDERVRLIFILNTNSRTKGRKTLSDILTPAMFSRCLHICFDIRNDELNEVIEASKKVYVNLEEAEIRKNLPDHRSLTRMNEMALYL